jgi:hypothetical protein
VPELQTTEYLQDNIFVIFFSNKETLFPEVIKSWFKDLCTDNLSE